MTNAATLFSAEIKSAKLEKLFRQAPEKLGPIIRDQVFRIVAGYRKRWLQRTEVEFSGSERRNFPLLGKVPSAITSGPRGGDAKKIFFVVTPERGAAIKRLEDIGAEVFSISDAWEHLEHGGTARGKGGKKLAIPIGITIKSDGKVKSQWDSPERFTRANKRGKSKTLVAIKKPGNKATILYWQKPRGAGKNKHFVYLPAFMLVDQVTQDRILHFYRTWDSEASNRTKIFNSLLEKAVQEIAQR
jgi:hypothetical protein